MSDKMKQGDSYEEESVELLGGTGPKIPKKALIAGIVVLAVAIIAIGVVAYLGRDKAPKIDESTSIDVDAIGTIAFSYTEEEKARLRAVGYTGDDIEKFQTDQASFQILVDTAIETQKEQLRATSAELRKEVMDSASQDYKNLLNLTWLAGQSIDVKPIEGGNEFDYTSESKKENVNYTKVPSHGNQVFLKLEFPEGEIYFMPIHPARYYQLRDKGNLVVSYDVVTFGDDKFLFNLMEVSIE